MIGWHNVVSDESGGADAGHLADDGQNIGLGRPARQLSIISQQPSEAEKQNGKKQYRTRKAHLRQMLGIGAVSRSV